MKDENPSGISLYTFYSRLLYIFRIEIYFPVRCFPSLMGSFSLHVSVLGFWWRFGRQHRIRFSALPGSSVASMGFSGFFVTSRLTFRETNEKDVVS